MTSVGLSRAPAAVGDGPAVGQPRVDSGRLGAIAEPPAM